MTVDFFILPLKKTENMSYVYEHDTGILCVRVEYEPGLPINYK